MGDASSSRPRVLVVDDSPDICELLTMWLASIGDVTVAHTGGEAVGLALETRPHLVMVDIFLPGLNGFEVVETLRRNLRDHTPPVVFMTGLREPANDYRARELGAVAVLHKPLTAESMRQIVIAALDTAVV